MTSLIFTRSQNKCARGNFLKMNVCENKLQIERKVYIFYSKNLLIDKSFINIISSNYMTHKCGIIIKYYDNGMFWIARN